MEQTHLRTGRKTGTVFILGTLALTAIMLAVFAAAIIYVDPFFHYHKPLDGFSYPLEDERYQNNGILRHFDYDSIVTGSSMCENFKTSEAEALFGGQFVKVPFMGCRYKEIGDNLRLAYSYRETIRTVVFCLDYSHLVEDKDSLSEFDYPTYLYNNNPFDDVSYLFNKQVLLEWTRKVLNRTAEGIPSTSFDDYASWAPNFPLGKEYVLEGCGERIIGDNVQPMTQQERDMELENLRQNIVPLVKEHPETDFYLFFPPYSICFWEGMRSDGKIGWQVEAERIAIEELLQYPNVHLYSFSDCFELVCDLDQYRDMIHFGGHISSWILECMATGEHQLTLDNYRDYLDRIQAFYMDYDYSAIRK